LLRRREAIFILFILGKNQYVVPLPKHKEIKSGLLLEIKAETDTVKEQFIELLNEL